MPDQFALRDIILLEADWLRLHADRLDVLAAKNKASPIGEMLRVIAISTRQRAKIMQDVLAATEPVEAKAS